MARKHKKKASPKQLISTDSTIRKLQTQLVDPKVQSWLWHGAQGVRERILQLNFRTLRILSQRLPLINAIINLRTDQVLPFCHFAVEEGDKGFVFEIENRTQEFKKAKIDENEIIQLSTFIEQTGFEFDVEREDDFSDYISMLIRDVYEIDQIATEIQRNRLNEVAAFWALDGATVMRVSDEKRFARGIRFVQMIEDKIYNEFKSDDMLFDYRYKRSDVRYRGYGYCLPSEARVLTNLGYLPIGEIVNYDVGVKIWDGSSFRLFTSIKSGKKPLRKIIFDDGSELETSPEHRIKTLSSNGDLVFKPQKDLYEGDWVVSNSNVVSVESYRGLTMYAETWSKGSFNIPKLTLEVCEIMGWLIGDGNFYTNEGFDRIRLFYYVGSKENKDDRDVLERHLSIFENMGISTPVYQKENGVVTIFITNKGFANYLKKLGLYPWKRATVKRVPRIIFRLNKLEICGFLRGLFSADGHIHLKSGLPMLSSADKPLLMDVQLLLNQIGVCSRIYTKKATKNRFSNRLSYVLVVTDYNIFFNFIGFIQTYKQANSIVKPTSRAWKRSDIIPNCYARKMALEVDSSLLNKSDKHTIAKLLSGSEKRNKTFNWFEQRGVSSNLRFKKVTEIIDCHKMVPMYDLSILNGEQQFIAEGIYVHNSPVEQCIDIITTLLFGYNYIRDQLMKDKVPKGFISVMGDVAKPQLDSIRNYWYAAMAGAGGQWAIPILPSGKDGVGIEFKNLSQSNKDMEYHKTIMFVSSLVAAVFSIDLAEMGIKTDDSTSLIGENMEPRIQHSKDRGLGSILSFIEQHINKIVRKFIPKYRFKFVGLEREDESKKAEVRSKQLTTHRTIDELREEDELKPFNEDWSKMPLHPQAVQIFLQDKQAEQAEQMQQQGGGFEFGDNGNGNQLEESPEEEEKESQSKKKTGDELFTAEKKKETRKSLEDFKKATDDKERRLRIVIE